MAVPLSEIISCCNKSFPQSWADSWDHVGLQLGDPNEKVKRILVVLDVNKDNVEEAINNKVSLIISHHPILFKETDRFTTSTTAGKLMWELAKKGCMVFAAHTNFDASKYSMSKNIGKLLNLQNLKPAFPKPQPGEIKIVTFVPEDFFDPVRKEMSKAGAGIIGDYIECSFGIEGTGTFMGIEGSKPAYGKKGRLEKVEEVRLEMICPKNKLNKVIDAMLKIHPYDEPAYDLFQMESFRTNEHYLWTGNLKNAKTLSEVEKIVKKKITDGDGVLLVGNPEREIKTFAICAGGAGFLVNNVAGLGVDCYLTGDFNHHDALEMCARGLTAIGAGHYNTEKFFIPNMCEFLEDNLKGVEIIPSKVNTNPFSRVG